MHQLTYEMRMFRIFIFNIYITYHIAGVSGENSSCLGLFEERNTSVETLELAMAKLWLSALCIAPKIIFCTSSVLLGFYH